MKINVNWQNMHQRRPVAFGMLLLGAMLLICSPSSVLRADETVSATSSEDSTPCKGLKPYNNLDELLYQFYINLENDCLFEMPTSELEKIWGIKILDEERAKPKNYYPLSETEFFNKPYRTEKDAFYIELTRNERNGLNREYQAVNRFKLKITKEYAAKHGSLLHNEKLPRLLPFPNYELYSTKYPPCVFPDYDGIIKGETHIPVCITSAWSSRNKERIIKINNSSEILIARYFNSQEKKNVENKSGKPSGNTLAAAENVPCRGLKPPNNVDEMLYQFYINLDSDCLFKMTVQELEKIWGLEIYTSDQDRFSFLLTNKFYKSKKDFFTSKSARAMTISFFMK